MPSRVVHYDNILLHYDYILSVKTGFQVKQADQNKKKTKLKCTIQEIDKHCYSMRPIFLCGLKKINTANNF